MYFPNAQVAVNPYLLLLLGLIVGTLGGFFGIGGGFLITGGLLVFGVPPVFALGTGLAVLMGTSIIGALRHRRAGNVDVKLGLLLVAGTLPAVLLAERLIAALEAAGLAGPFIRYLYVALLTALAAFILYDTWRNRRGPKGSADQVSTQGLIQKVQALRIPPNSIRLLGGKIISTHVALPVSGIERLSAFVPVAAGLGVGFLGGLLGAGGGFILVPVLIFVLGVPTRVAIGASLFQVIFTGVLGTLLYARSNHVDLVMAVVMLAAASAGSRLGVAATRLVPPRRIRLLFSFTLVGGALAVAMKQIAEGNQGLDSLSTVAAVVLLSSSGAICLVLAVLVALSLRKKSSTPR